MLCYDARLWMLNYPSGQPENLTVFCLRGQRKSALGMNGLSTFNFKSCALVDDKSNQITHSTNRLSISKLYANLLGGLKPMLLKSYYLESFIQDIRKIFRKTNARTKLMIPLRMEQICWKTNILGNVKLMLLKLHLLGIVQFLMEDPCH